MTKRGLGKGLQALIPSAPLGEDELRDIHWIEIENIQPNKHQPRRNIDAEKLGELSESIKEHGVVQPIVVRKVKENTYELVAGERRWRASKLAGLDKVPAIIKEYDNQQISEIALIENIQREDLNPVEEAWAYKMLIENFQLTQETLSKKVGKSRPHIANALRLLSLPKEIIIMLSAGKISPGHARALMAIDSEEEQKELARRIAGEKLSVREAEQLVSGILQAGGKQKKRTAKKEMQAEPMLLVIEENLQEALGTKVLIKHKGAKGKIEIDYYSEEDLERIVEIIVKK